MASQIMNLLVEKNIQISDKFVKEIVTFEKWLGNHYTLNTEIINQLNQFDYQEPGRNKLDTLVKKICEMSILLSVPNNTIVTDYKVITNEFKNREKTSQRGRKPKQVSDDYMVYCKEQKEPKKEKPQDKNKKQKKHVPEVVNNTDNTNENSQEKILKININHPCDTTKFYYVDTIKKTYSQLINEFGEPIQKSNITEWTIKIGDIIFSISGDTDAYEWDIKSNIGNLGILQALFFQTNSTHHTQNSIDTIQEYDTVNIETPELDLDDSNLDDIDLSGIDDVFDETM